MTRHLKLTRTGLPVPLLIILGLFVAAKVLYLLKYHLPVWDEAVYLGMGKYIYSLGQSGLWETIRPPGLPLLIGAFWKLKLPYVFLSEVVAVLFGAGAIALSYLLANRLFNRKVAMLAAAILASSPWFFLYSSYILTEVPSAFLVLLSLYFFVTKRYAFSGAVAGIAFLFKFPNGILLIVVAVTLAVSAVMKKQLLRKQLPDLAKFAASFAVVTAPFFVFNYLFYRPFTGNAFDAAFRPVILGAWHQSNPSKAIGDVLFSYSFYLIEAFRQHFVLVFAAAAAFLFWKRRWFADSGKLLLALFLLAFFAYFTYIPNKDARYLLPFLPAICIFAAAAFVEVFGFLLSFRKTPAVVLALVASASLLVLSFSVAAYKDYHFYSWRPSAEPPLVGELYRSMARFGLTGPVLTSEPVFAAYNDNLFLAYYDTSSGIPKSLKPSWDLAGKPVEAVVFSPQSFYCPAADSGCYRDLDQLHSSIASGYLPVFNGTYYDSRLSYYVFVNKSLYSQRKSQ